MLLNAMLPFFLEEKESGPELFGIWNSGTRSFTFNNRRTQFSDIGYASSPTNPNYWRATNLTAGRRSITFQGHPIPRAGFPSTSDALRSGWRLRLIFSGQIRYGDSPNLSLPVATTDRAGIRRRAYTQISVNISPGVSGFPRVLTIIVPPYPNSLVRQGFRIISDGRLHYSLYNQQSNSTPTLKVGSEYIIYTANTIETSFTPELTDGMRIKVTAASAIGSGDTSGFNISYTKVSGNIPDNTYLSTKVAIYSV